MVSLLLTLTFTPRSSVDGAFLPSCVLFSIGQAGTTGETVRGDKHPSRGRPRIQLLADASPPSLFGIGPARACQVGARLLHFQHVWAASISDFWTIKAVSSEHAWSFTNTPLLRFAPTRLPHREDLSAVVGGSGCQGMYSPLFLVLKKNYSWHPVIDLMYLSKFVKNEKF